MRVPLSSDTPAWRFQTWAAFVLSLGATTLGVIYLDVELWTKAYLGLGLWFTVSSTLALSKTVRDHHESQKIHTQVNEAQTERILRDMAA